VRHASRHAHSPRLDDKGRVVLPAKFRDELTGRHRADQGPGQLRGAVASRRSSPPTPQRLNEASRSNAAVRSYLRVLFSGSLRPGARQAGPHQPAPAAARLRRVGPRRGDRRATGPRPRSGTSPRGRSTWRRRSSPSRSSARRWSPGCSSSRPCCEASARSSPGRPSPDGRTPAPPQACSRRASPAPGEAGGDLMARSFLGTAAGGTMVDNGVGSTRVQPRPRSCATGSSELLAPAVAAVTRTPPGSSSTARSGWAGTRSTSSPGISGPHRVVGIDRDQQPPSRWRAERLAAVRGPVRPVPVGLRRHRWCPREAWGHRRGLQELCSTSACPACSWTATNGGSLTVETTLLDMRMDPARPGHGR
jgi:hypothetical protein